MTINWDVFHIFTIVSVILWIISAVTSAMKDGISKTAFICKGLHSEQWEKPDYGIRSSWEYPA